MILKDSRLIALLSVLLTVSYGWPPIPGNQHHRRQWEEMEREQRGWPKDWHPPMEHWEKLKDKAPKNKEPKTNQSRTREPKGKEPKGKEPKGKEPKGKR